MHFDRRYSPEEIVARTGALNQLARIVPSRLESGRQDGVRILDVQNGTGFRFVVVPDRGMDIAWAECGGYNLCWMSPTGIVGPQFYESAGAGWMRGFFGGLLTTCGLVTIGAPDNYRGDSLGMHGRASWTPAERVSHEVVQEDVGRIRLSASGEIPEVRPPHTHLVRRRTITVFSGDSHLEVHDTVTNHGFESIPIQVLYHVNAGFPVVSGCSKFVCASSDITPRDRIAHETRELYSLCEEPSSGFEEQVFFHSVAPGEDGSCRAAVIHPGLEGGFGLYVRYDSATLPFLTQWKMMAAGTYVMGIEPCNSYGVGMEKLRAYGLLRHIEPGETIDYRLEIGALRGTAAVEAFERAALANAPSSPMFHSCLV